MIDPKTLAETAEAVKRGDTVYKNRLYDFCFYVGAESLEGARRRRHSEKLRKDFADLVGSIYTQIKLNEAFGLDGVYVL